MRVAWQNPNSLLNKNISTFHWHRGLVRYSIQTSPHLAIEVTSNVPEPFMSKSKENVHALLGCPRTETRKAIKDQVPRSSQASIDSSLGVPMSPTAKNCRSIVMTKCGTLVPLHYDLLNVLNNEGLLVRLVKWGRS